MISLESKEEILSKDINLGAISVLTHLKPQEKMRSASEYTEKSGQGKRKNIKVGSLVDEKELTKGIKNKKDQSSEVAEGRHLGNQVNSISRRNE